MRGKWDLALPLLGGAILVILGAAEAVLKGTALDARRVICGGAALLLLSTIWAIERRHH